MNLPKIVYLIEKAYKLTYNTYLTDPGYITYLTDPGYFT